MIIRWLSYPIMMALAACGVDESDLLGTYRFSGDGGRDATLELSAPGRYRFCLDGRCSDGAFTSRPLGKGGVETGRIEFVGAEFEAFADQLFAEAVGREEMRRIKGPPLGRIELSYEIGVLTTQIWIEPSSDTSFMKP